MRREDNDEFSVGRNLEGDGCRLFYAIIPIYDWKEKI
jgi:hypothetical protein